MLNILNVSMVTTSFRFITVEMGKGNAEEVNKVFNISLVLHACLALLVILLAETVGIYYIRHFLNVPADRISDAIFVFRFSVLAAIFSISSVPFQGLITSQEQFSVRSLIDVISALLRLAAAISLLYHETNRLRLYSVLTTLAIALTSILYISYCYKKYRAIICWNFQSDRSRYKEMVGFSGWMTIEACASMGKVQGAALIINVFFGTVINASFGIANQISSLLSMFSQNLSQAAIPQITKSYSGGNSDRSMQLACYVNKYSFFLMLLPALPILLETSFLLNLWLDQVPEYTRIFCQLVVINTLAGCLGEALPTVVQATGKIKYFQIILSTAMLLSLPMAYLLFRLKFPPYSILIVNILIMLTINLVIFPVLLKRLIHFDIKKLFNLSYLKIFYVVLLVSPLFILKNIYPEGLVRFVFLSIAAMIWLLVVVYFVGIESDEKKLVCSMLSRFCNKWYQITFKSK